MEETEVDLRHLAVSSDARGKWIGRSLVMELFCIAVAQDCCRIRTTARSSSFVFLQDLGFRSAGGEAPPHPSFPKHGITFPLMERDVPDNPET
jgi:GNAT superfamily N-acetyltransferase